MGTYTAQLSLGALQYERLQEWMASEKYIGKTDVFIRDKFLELLENHPVKSVEQKRKQKKSE